MVLSTVPGENLSSTFLNGSTLLYNILTKEQAPAKTTLPKCVPTIAKALLVFHGITHVNECAADGLLHVKMQWKMCCRIRAAMQIVTRAYSTLSKSVGLGSFQTAFSPCLLYEASTAIVHVLKSQEDVCLCL